VAIKVPDFAPERHLDHRGIKPCISSMMQLIMIWMDTFCAIVSAVTAVWRLHWSRLCNVMRARVI
jgi:phage-related protein